MLTDHVVRGRQALSALQHYFSDPLKLSPSQLQEIQLLQQFRARACVRSLATSSTCMRERFLNNNSCT